ncbi:hypothetical protein SteCoe_425 [Stentor coeruleus]|uniref:Uncharacterized protein n=1 Tax=Stentor coeruleus TaxID=5963 RepID=A0A1R2D480_9CILI|nr:hypothetical protein SteCoe_425 [Stentor coeruleus]
MSSAFQERFKNRVNYIGKQGVIEIENSTGIQKPLNSQIFDTPFQPLKAAPLVEKIIDKFNATSYEIPTSPGPAEIKIPETQVRKQTQSAKPYLNTDQQTRTEMPTQQSFKNFGEFKPYTLQDYKTIKSDKYYELGGLGPSNIGSEEWKKKKEMFEKRLSYGKQVMQVNSNLPPSSMRKPFKEPDIEVSKSERTRQFVRVIPRPLIKDKKLNCESTPAVSSVLEELEQQHLAYKASLQNLWTEYK